MRHCRTEEPSSGLVKLSASVSASAGCWTSASICVGERRRRYVAATHGDGVCVEDDEVDVVGVVRLAGFGAVLDGDGDVGVWRDLERVGDFGDLSAKKMLQGDEFLRGQCGEEIGGVCERRGPTSQHQVHRQRGLGRRRGRRVPCFGCSSSSCSMRRSRRNRRLFWSLRGRCRRRYRHGKTN